MRLRSEVFVVEQTSIYQDVDNKDQKALHILGTIGGEMIAYARIFDKGHYFKETSIGRVVVQRRNNESTDTDMSYCSFPYKVLKKYFLDTSIKISAQCYLEAFYMSHGFESKGASYLEDGIPHIAMYRS